ncbi:MAG: hypothetical protein ACJ79E_01580 [Anaeromyxobacteraceae bacterium]
MIGRVRRIAVLPLIMMATGCSAVFVSPTPHVGDDGRLACTRAAGVFPALDAAAGFGIAALGAFTAGLGNSTDGYNGCENNPALCHHNSPTGGYVAGGVLAASALYGIVAATVCESRLGRDPAEVHARRGTPADLAAASVDASAGQRTVP